MNITREENNYVVQNFYTLKKGDVFKFAADDATYMVIASCGIGYNAVDLETGDLMFAEEYDDVYKIDYTFTVKE